MMNTILLSALFYLKGLSDTATGFDVANPLPFLALGLVAILVIAAIIILIIVFSVKRLKRIRNKNSNTPQ